MEKTTIHCQTGPRVYLFRKNAIYDLRIKHEAEIVFSDPEVVGSNQGEGVETVWWNGSNEPIMQSDNPEALMRIGKKIHRKLEAEAKRNPTKFDEDGNALDQPVRKRVITTKEARKRKTISNNSVENDDWMKSLPGYNEERLIHERLAVKHKRSQRRK
jgi:hypothetical protein